MKKLELNQMEIIDGGSGIECAAGILGGVLGLVGIGLMIAFPPAGLAVAMLGGAAAGIAEGATIFGAIMSCS